MGCMYFFELQFSPYICPRVELVGHAQSFRHVQLFTVPWTVAHLAPLSMGSSRQVYWSEVPCPPPGDLPNPGNEPMSFGSPALAGGFFTTKTTWAALLGQSYGSYILVFSGTSIVRYIGAGPTCISTHNTRELPSRYHFSIPCILALFILAPWFLSELALRL